MDTHPQAILAVRDVHRDFGGVKAVDGASFSALRGNVTGLIGPNGAGKSTLLGIIAGAIRAGSGTVTFDGKDVSGLPPNQIARRGLIRTFQLSAAFAKLSVLDDM